MMTTTFVRAAIKYSKKIIGTDENGDYEYSATYHGEGYTYWRAVSAWVATFDDTNAKVCELYPVRSHNSGLHLKLVAPSMHALRFQMLDAQRNSLCAQRPLTCPTPTNLSRGSESSLP